MSRGRRPRAGTHLEQQAEQLGLTVAQMRLLRTVARKTVVRPGPRTMLVMDELTQHALVELRAWGRYVITSRGRSAVSAPVLDMPVFMTDGGSLRFRLLPPDREGSLGRWAVDDGIPDRERGYSTAREYETDTGSLEARGLTTDPSRRSQTSGDAEYEDLGWDGAWTWKHDADQRHRRAQPRHERAARLRRIGGAR